MKRFAEIDGDKVGSIWLEGEAPPASVEVGQYVRTGDLWNNGDPLKPDGSAYSDSEKQVTFDDPLDIANSLSDSELDELWDSAAYNVPSARRTVARRILLALSTASQIRSRSSQTKALVAAAIGYGFITAERARIIFQDSGVA